MSDSETDLKRMKLVELAQFVLSRKTENIRSELWEYLICGAIYHIKAKHGLAKEDIHSSIEEFYKLDAPPKLIDSNIRNLVSKNDLIPVPREGQETYMLSESKLADISSKNKEYDTLRDKVVQEIIARVKTAFPALSEHQSREIVDVLFHIIGSIFKRYGSICSDIISGRIDEVKGIQHLPDFQQISLNNVRRIGEPSLRKVVKDEFRNLFADPSADCIYFLQSMAQSYTIAQILNLDPELQMLEKESFSKKKLFLDTNIIVSLMCVADAYESVSEVVSLTKDLGVEMVYTPETRKEFLDLLKYSKRLYGRVPTHKKSIIKKVEPLMTNPFIASYWMESGQKRLAWEAFVARMEGFQEFLKDKFSIAVDTTKISGIWSDPEYTELERAVYLADIGKPGPTVAHDAYHLLMIKKIREKGIADELGMQSYFLTRDHTLDTAERTIYRGGTIPSNLSIDVWSQMILPFLSPKVIAGEASGAYMKIMSSKFPSLTKSLDPKDVIDVMGVWMDDPSVTTDLLRRIIGTRYVQEHLEKLREQKEKKPSEISRVISPILGQALSATRKKHEDALANIKSKYDQKISTLEKKIDRLEDVPLQRKRTLLFVTGAFFFGVLVVLTLVSGFLQCAFPDAAYWVLGVCGTALISASVFGPIVFERFKNL